MRRPPLWLVAVFAFLIGFVWFVASLPHWIWEPDGYCAAAGNRAAVAGCKGYNLWSGILGSFLTSLPGWFIGLSVFLAAWWKTHNCHVHGCLGIAWAPHPDHGHPVCRGHHPHGESDILHARHHLHEHTRGHARRVSIRALANHRS